MEEEAGEGEDGGDASGGEHGGPVEGMDLFFAIPAPEPEAALGEVDDFDDGRRANCW